MKDNRSLEQVWRADSADSFVEVMLTGLVYDKVLLNFCRYDASKEKNQRMIGSVGVFMDIYEAQRLARDILSGRICALGTAAKKKAAETGSKYAPNVFSVSGGTSASRRSDGKAVARTFSIAPGSKYPWILCAMQGEGEEVGSGLIKMKGKADVIVRVPLSNEKLKELALAIETVERIWEQSRFMPVVQDMMDEALARRKSVIDKAMAETAADNIAQTL